MFDLYGEGEEMSQFSFIPRSKDGGFFLSNQDITFYQIVMKEIYSERYCVICGEIFNFVGSLGVSQVLSSFCSIHTGEVKSIKTDESHIHKKVMDCCYKEIDDHNHSYHKNMNINKNGRYIGKGCFKTSHIESNKKTQTGNSTNMSYESMLFSKKGIYSTSEYKHCIHDMYSIETGIVILPLFALKHIIYVRNSMNGNINGKNNNTCYIPYNIINMDIIRDITSADVNKDIKDIVSFFCSSFPDKNYFYVSNPRDFVTMFKPPNGIPDKYIQIKSGIFGITLDPFGVYNTLLGKLGLHIISNRSILSKANMSNQSQLLLPPPSSFNSIQNKEKAKGFIENYMTKSIKQEPTNSNDSTVPTNIDINNTFNLSRNNDDDDTNIDIDTSEEDFFFNLATLHEQNQVASLVKFPNKKRKADTQLTDNDEDTYETDTDSEFVSDKKGNHGFMRGYRTSSRSLFNTPTKIIKMNNMTSVLNTQKRNVYIKNEGEPNRDSSHYNGNRVRPPMVSENTEPYYTSMSDLYGIEMKKNSSKNNEKVVESQNPLLISDTPMSSSRQTIYLQNAERRLVSKGSLSQEDARQYHITADGLYANTFWNNKNIKSNEELYNLERSKRNENASTQRALADQIDHFTEPYSGKLDSLTLQEEIKKIGVYYKQSRETNIMNLQNNDRSNKREERILFIPWSVDSYGFVPFIVFLNGKGEKY